MRRHTTTLGLLLLVAGAWATQNEISRELDPYDAERFLYSVSQAIQAPGTVDLSRLVFSHMKQYSYSQSTDDTYNMNNNNENDGNDPYNEMAIIEAALLYCGPSNNNDNCNLQQLGIGKYSDGIHYRCCTTDAMTAGVCENEGRLVVDDDVFSGQWFDVVAAGNDNNYTIDNPIRTVQQSGVYMVVLANCNPYGIPVWTKGQLGFRSRYGYLLAKDWTCSWISHMFTLLSAAALVWLYYRHNTRRSMDAVLLITVSLAFVQSFVLGLYYLRYNRTGIAPDTLYRVQRYMNALTLSLANVCMVLAAFGWGCLDNKVYKSVPIHTIFGLGTVCVIILSIIASCNDQHMFIVGEMLNILFALWALQVNLKTLHMLRSKNEELFRRWAFMRALLVLSICQSGVLGCIYFGVSRNSGGSTQRIFMIVQQFGLLAILGALAYLVRPYNETLLSGKDGMDTESRESNPNKRGMDP